MNDKLELLEEVELVLNPKKGLDLAYLLSVLLAISLVGIIFFPKIYLQQQIYFKSRDISKLKSEYDILKEENKIISTSVESIKFKNQILDTMF